MIFAKQEPGKTVKLQYINTLGYKSVMNSNILIIA